MRCTSFTLPMLGIWNLCLNIWIPFFVFWCKPEINLSSPPHTPKKETTLLKEKFSVSWSWVFYLRVLVVLSSILACSSISHFKRGIWSVLLSPQPLPMLWKFCFFCYLSLEFFLGLGASLCNHHFIFILKICSNTAWDTKISEALYHNKDCLF